MASIATRSAAKRPEAMPRSVCHTTGIPVRTNPAFHTAAATLLRAARWSSNPLMMQRRAPAGRR